MCFILLVSLYFLITLPNRTCYSFQVLHHHRVAHFKVAALTSRVWSSSLSSLTRDIIKDDRNLDTFQKCLQRMPLSSKKQTEIYDTIQEMGFESSSELFLLSKDFRDRPEALSSLLRSDFGLGPIQSNLIRGALMTLVEFMDDKEEGQDDDVNPDIRDIGKAKKHNGDDNDDDLLHDIVVVHDDHDEASSLSQTPSPNQSNGDGTTKNDSNGISPKPLFKAVVVNQKAKQRHSSATAHNYGLPNNYETLYPNLAKDLDNFYQYMTTPSASVQESPIRKATASVYIRHAKLFLGSYRDTVAGINGVQGDDSFTIQLVFPRKDAKCAQPIIDFILWLRRTRHISDSYEANMLRGLTKLVKYRFRDESTADPSYGEKSYSDIPIVRELRKLHRDANRRQVLSPRSSEEDRKWLEWKDYLHVVKLLKEDVEKEIKAYQESNSKNSIARERKIAIKFQSYLVLSFFSCVPDRQRTFRELEIDKSFLRDTKTNCWTIKHGPNDYKTGKTYGDRPPLVLAQDLTPAIDEFLQRWRPCLKPTGKHFFVQPRTGNPFTQDTLYAIVARSCFKHTGKKTNPHLLRDMIVTHVRDSDASEKELEALALYMGHSISMQRNSYDRRTVEQKVAPAVELLRNVNRVSGG